MPARAPTTPNSAQLSPVGWSECYAAHHPTAQTTPQPPALRAKISSPRALAHRPASATRNHRLRPSRERPRTFDPALPLDCLPTLAAARPAPAASARLQRTAWSPPPRRSLGRTLPPPPAPSRAADQPSSHERERPAVLPSPEETSPTHPPRQARSIVDAHTLDDGAPGQRRPGTLQRGLQTCRYLEHAAIQADSSAGVGSFAPVGSIMAQLTRGRVSKIAPTRYTRVVV